MPNLKYYKMYDDVTEPVFATKGSACFDICAYVKGVELFTYNDSSRKNVPKQLRQDGNSVGIYPGERLMIPTGIIFDIPENHSVRLHPRSGLAYKNGLTIVNGEGVIDSDFVDELKILIINTSEVNQIINHGDRVCQGEMIKDLSYSFILQDKPPKSKTDRDGGFGSTGK